MKFLLTSDLHLTDHPKDAYRWSIFPWLTMHGINREVDAIFLLGDITDKKDHHSNEFINDIVDALRKLATDCKCPVIIIKGNHDYINANKPLLRLLDHCSGAKEALLETGEWRNEPYFFTYKQSIKIKGVKILLVPNVKRWDSLKIRARGHKFMFIHQTIKGAVVSNGTAMEKGIRHNYLASKYQGGAQVISGDIHVPQRIKNVLYCGSPYPVAFGDTYEPRVIFYDGKKIKSIRRASIKKVVARIEEVAELDDLGLVSGDQVRIVISIPRSSFGRWPEIVKAANKKAKKMGLEVHGVELREKKRQSKLIGPYDDPEIQAESPRELLDEFCDIKNIDEPLVDVARSLITKRVPIK